jgi:polar amino acid transport system substrate-binding protein
MTMRTILALIVMAALVIAGIPGGDGVALRPVDRAEAADIRVPAPGESATVDRIRSSGVLRAGTVLSPPGLIEDPRTGKLVGVAVGLTEEIARLLGVKIEYISANWDTIIPGLLANKYDLAIAGLFATKARLQVVDIAPYRYAGKCYFVLKDNPKVNSLADIDKPEVTFVLFIGTADVTFIKEKYPKARTYEIQTPVGVPLAVEDVMAKRADIAPFDSPLVFWFAQTYPQFKIIPEPKTCATSPDVPGPIGMAYPKGDEALGAFLKAVIASLRAKIDLDTITFTQPNFIKPPGTR